jgi:Flp pilus assembly protein TadG
MTKIRIISRKGQVIILVTFAVVLLLLLVGLALDSGIGYAVKAKLNSAVDAAAIAAGRALSEGSNDAERQANAEAAATTFFNANFPANYLRARVTSGPTVVTEHDTSTGEWHITVTASAEVPTYFLRIRGNNSFSASSASMALKRDVDMVLVLDCSGSLGPPTSPASTFPALKAAAIDFINKFNDGAGGDRVGLVTFASGAVTSVDINKDATRGFVKTAVINAINALTVGGATDSEEAMRRALAELDAVPAGVRSSLRVIVFFSDGAPNTVAGNFNSGGSIFLGDLYSETSSGSPPNRLFQYNSRDRQLPGSYSISILPTTDYTGTVPLASYNSKRILSPLPGNAGSNTRCNVNKAARNMVENVANMARSEPPPDSIHVYTLGLGADLETLEITFCGYGPDEHGENILKRLANTSDSDTYDSNQPSGLYVYAADASELDDAFQTIAAHIFRLTR